MDDLEDAILDAFHVMDPGGCGWVSFESLKESLLHQGLEHISEEEVDELLANADANGEYDDGAL